MSLEAALIENTAAVKELIELLKGGATVSAPTSPSALSSPPVEVETSPATSTDVGADPEPLDENQLRAMVREAAVMLGKKHGPQAVQSITSRYGEKLSEIEVEALPTLVEELRAALVEAA